MEWREEAACRDTGVEMWFPGQGQGSSRQKRICQGCTVQGECLEYALTKHVRHGIWGGMTERELRDLRRREDAQKEVA